MQRDAVADAEPLRGCGSRCISASREVPCTVQPRSRSSRASQAAVLAGDAEDEGGPAHAARSLRFLGPRA